MPFVAKDYRTHPGAPEGQWVCTPGSGQGPFKEAPEAGLQGGPHYCGQCVSYVKQVCPDLPRTREWRKGDAVKGHATIREGTVIATFDAEGRYLGHAAIYVSQKPDTGVEIYDQWVSPPAKAIGQRRIRWQGSSPVNSGDAYFVVEPPPRP